jgi:hypothetical protein
MAGQLFFACAALDAGWGADSVTSVLTTLETPDKFLQYLKTYPATTSASLHLLVI